MAKNVDPHEIADILREQSAIHILPRFRQLKTDEIFSKTSATDLVTVADREMELALIDILPKKLHGSIVLGEEGVSAKTISIDELDNTSRPIWVTDPVDGTFNFVNGKEEFCTMLGLVVNGVTQMSWILDPLTGRMMIAERGAGAFFDNKRLKLSPQNKSLSQLSGFAGMKYFPKSMRDHMESTKEAVIHMGTLSCAGHEYLRLGQGLADYAVYTRVKPWDHLAGHLMLEEAGGYITKWDGTPYTPQTKEGGILAVTDKNNWQGLHDLFIKHILPPTQQTVENKQPYPSPGSGGGV